MVSNSHNAFLPYVDNTMLNARVNAWLEECDFPTTGNVEDPLLSPYNSINQGLSGLTENISDSEEDFAGFTTALPHIQDDGLSFTGSNDLEVGVVRVYSPSARSINPMLPAYRDSDDEGVLMLLALDAILNTENGSESGGVNDGTTTQQAVLDNVSGDSESEAEGVHYEAGANDGTTTQQVVTGNASGDSKNEPEGVYSEAGANPAEQTVVGDVSNISDDGSNYCDNCVIA